MLGYGYAEDTPEIVHSMPADCVTAYQFAQEFDVDDSEIHEALYELWETGDITLQTLREYDGDSYYHTMVVPRDSVDAARAELRRLFADHDCPVVDAPAALPLTTGTLCGACGKLVTP